MTEAKRRNRRRYQPATSPEAAEGAPERKHNREVHGHYRIKKALIELERQGLKVLDRRYAIGKESQRWRQGVVADCGGPDQVSTQAATILDAAETTRVLLRHIDQYLTTLPSIINRRRKQLIPIIAQRQQLADSLVRYMTTLGLEKRGPRELTLEELLNQPEEEAQSGD